MESQSPPPDGAPVIPAAEPSKDEKTMAMICHLLAFSGFLLPHIPGMNIVGPLILWAIKKDTMPFVNEQGKEAINFNITLAIAALGLTITILLIPLLIPLAIAAVVLVILAAIKANEGVHYRYPYILRLVK